MNSRKKVSGAPKKETLLPIISKNEGHEKSTLKALNARLLKVGITHEFKSKDLSWHTLPKQQPKPKAEAPALPNLTPARFKKVQEIFASSGTRQKHSLDPDRSFETFLSSKEVSQLFKDFPEVMQPLLTLSRLTLKELLQEIDEHKIWVTGIDQDKGHRQGTEHWHVDYLNQSSLDIRKDFFPTLEKTPESYNLCWGGSKDSGTHYVQSDKGVEIPVLTTESVEKGLGGHDSTVVNYVTNHYVDSVIKSEKLSVFQHKQNTWVCATGIIHKSAPVGTLGGKEPRLFMTFTRFCAPYYGAIH